MTNSRENQNKRVELEVQILVQVHGFLCIDRSRNTQVNVCVDVYICTYVPYLCPLWVPGSSNASIYRVQILASPLYRTRAPQRNG